MLDPSKVAAGPKMAESHDQILNAEGRDAGLGLAARLVIMSIKTC